MGFIDSHAHLDDARFAPDCPDVLARARAAGVSKILAIANGTRPGDFQKTLTLAQDGELVCAAVGVHPHEASGATGEFLGELEQLAQSPGVVAWGEIGLDYHYDHSPRDVQQAVFRQQLQRARRLRLPVVIHCREAWEDCLEILSQEWVDSGLGGVFHCFSGHEAAAHQGVEWGFLISFAGNVSFPRSDALRQVAKNIPLESLLIETDSPYLAPPPHRGKRNEPAYVVRVAATLAEVRGTSREEIGEQTAQNFLRLFGSAQT